MPDTVMIVAGETSGELYGALLADQILEIRPDVTLIGKGGERMQKAGVELIAGIASAFGITEAASALKSIKASFRKVVVAMDERKPSVLVLIDYPDFNLKLAAEAKKRKIPVLYYVSPQVWAWRRGRVKKIATLVDRMAVVLPFEPGLYENTSLPCEFVGHPVWDEIHTFSHDKGELKKDLGIDAARPAIALLPGSRPSELKRLLPLLAAAAQKMSTAEPGIQFCMPLAPNTDPREYEAMTAPLAALHTRISKGDSLRVLAACDAAVIASGTATLQAALLGIPMTVVYKVTAFSFWLGKKIVKVPHISLVNILAGKGVVAELLQNDASPAKISDEVRRIRFDAQAREEMTAAFASIRAIYEQKRASQRVAEIVAELAGWQTQGSGYAASV